MPHVEYTYLTNAFFTTFNISWNFIFYLLQCTPKPHIKWVPCHHGMARPQVVDGGDGLQIWRVAANVLNKQSRTTDRGWSSSMEVGRGANNHHRKTTNLLQNIH
jgi:hypothetical protein